MRYLVLLLIYVHLFSDTYVKTQTSPPVESTVVVNSEFGAVFDACDMPAAYGDVITVDAGNVCSNAFDLNNISWSSYQYKTYLGTCVVIETTTLSVNDTRYKYSSSTSSDLICTGQCNIPIPSGYLLTGVDCNEAPPVGKYTATMCGCPYNENGDAHLYGLPNPDYTPTCEIDCNDPNTWQSDLNNCNVTGGQFNMTCDDTPSVCKYESTCSLDNNQTDNNSTDSNNTDPNNPDPTDNNTSEPIDDPFDRKDVPCASHPYTKVVATTANEGRWSESLKKYYKCECITGYIFDDINERCVQDYNDDEPPCNNCEQARQRAQGLCDEGISQETCIDSTCQYMFSCKYTGGIDGNSTSDDYTPPSPDGNGTVAMDLSPLLKKMDDTSNRNSKDLNAINDQMKMANNALDILHQDNRKSHDKLDRLDSTLKGIDNTNNKILQTNQGILSNTALTATATQKSANSLNSMDGKMDDLIKGIGKLDKNLSFESNGTGIYDKQMLDELKKLNDLNDTKFSDLNSTGLKKFVDKLEGDIKKIEGNIKSFNSLLKNGLTLQLPNTSMPVLSVDVFGSTLKLNLCSSFSYFRPVLSFIFTIILLFATIKLYFYGFSKVVSNG